MAAESFKELADQELIDRFAIETEVATQDVLFAEIQDRKLFPATTSSQWEADAGLYPDTDDPQFIEKIMHKQEFAENLQESVADQQRRGDNPCDSNQEFELTPVQRFISRFMSPQCPYLSALLFHGVGVGKTCAAITTAEEQLRAFPRTPVIIVAPRNIQPGFRRTIFDEESLTIATEDFMPNTLKGCTGNTYLKRTGSEYEREKPVIVRRITQSVNSRYTILGYIQFHRYIQEILDTVPKSLPPERRQQEEIKVLRSKFSGRLVIIDEAHNLRDTPGETEDDNTDVAGGDVELSEAKAGKRLTPSLLRVLEAAEGMKLMLLTGTPMYNNYKEILFLAKLLLINDKKVPISERAVFTPTGHFVAGGEEKLGAIASAYISYMRGENPLSFPVRLPPQNVPTLTAWATMSPVGEEVFSQAADVPQRTREIIARQRDILLKLPFVPVSFEGNELKIIRSIADEATETGGLGVRSIDEMVQSGNWLFPSEDAAAPPSSRIREAGFEGAFEEIKDGSTLSQYRSRMPTTWLSKKNIASASPKAALILNRIPKTKGIVFIYSRFIRSGAIPMAIALEANGYTPWNRDKPLFAAGIVDGGGRQCALCEAREKMHIGKSHKFTPAKYVLLTGQANFSPNNSAAIQASRSAENKDGENVKVIIGSQVASEGIDLRFVREIYVFDSWFHLNKMEQVLGRGVRTCSHSLLPEAKRNCTIHLLLNTYKDDPSETADMYMYRNALQKSMQIGRVTRVIKRYALDCNLNHNAIFIRDMEPIPMLEDSQGAARPNVSINDTPGTSICDWMECSYSCAKPVDIKKSMKESRIDTSSYDEYAMRWRESQIKQILKQVFENEDQPMIQIDSLIETLRAADIPEMAIRTILADVVGHTSFRLTINGQEGYIIYRNTYYLFQPLRITDVRIPLALRVADVPVRKDEYEGALIPISTPAPLPTEEAAEGKEEEGPAEPSLTLALWNAYDAWATQIRDGTAELDIPMDILELIKRRYVDDEFKRHFNILAMISWMVEHIQRSPLYDEESRAKYLKVLAATVIEMLWDGSFKATEQQAILAANPERGINLRFASSEQIVKRGITEAFRYVSVVSGLIEYACGAERCSEAIVRLFESNTADPINGVQANRTTTGPIYGFIIPKLKDTRLVFKTGDRPVDAGIKPEKGGECEIVSSIEIHKKSLREIRTMIGSLGYPPFLLSDEVLNEKEQRKVEPKEAKKKKATGEEVSAAELEFRKMYAKLRLDTRKFQNVIKACALKEIILRMVDKLEQAKGRKRYFYRPVSAIKSQHKLK